MVAALLLAAVGAAAVDAVAAVVADADLGALDAAGPGSSEAAVGVGGLGCSTCCVVLDVACRLREALEDDLEEGPVHALGGHQVGFRAEETLVDHRGDRRGDHLAEGSPAGRTALVDLEDVAFGLVGNVDQVPVGGYLDSRVAAHQGFRSVPS